MFQRSLKSVLVITQIVGSHKALISELDIQISNIKSPIEMTQLVGKRSWLQPMLPTFFDDLDLFSWHLLTWLSNLEIWLLRYKPLLPLLEYIDFHRFRSIDALTQCAPTYSFSSCLSWVAPQQISRLPDISIWSNIGVSCVPESVTRLSSGYHLIVHLVRPLLRKSYALPSCDRGIPSTMRGRGLMPALSTSVECFW